MWRLTRLQHTAQSVCFPDRTHAHSQRWVLDLYAVSVRLRLSLLCLSPLMHVIAGVSFWNLYLIIFCVLSLFIMDIMYLHSLMFATCLCGFYLLLLSPSCLPLSLSLDLKPLMKNKQDGRPLLLLQPPHSLYFLTSSLYSLSFPPPPLISLSPSYAHLTSPAALDFYLFLLFHSLIHHLAKKDPKTKSAAPALTKWLRNWWFKKSTGDIEQQDVKLLHFEWTGVWSVETSVYIREIWMKIKTSCISTLLSECCLPIILLCLFLAVFYSYFLAPSPHLLLALSLHLFSSLCGNEYWISQRQTVRGASPEEG